MTIENKNSPDKNTTQEKVTFFRSCTMNYLRIYIPFEQLRQVVSELGVLGCLEFVDVSEHSDALNKSTEPQENNLASLYRKDVFKLKNIMSNLTNLKNLMLQHEINDFEQEIVEFPLFVGHEETINDKYNKVKELQTALDSLKLKHDQVLNYLNAVQKSHEILDASEQSEQYKDIFENIVDQEKGGVLNNNASVLECCGQSIYTTNTNIHLNRLIGTIDSHKLFCFEKILWRSVHGNIIFKHILNDCSALNENQNSSITKNTSTFVCFVIGNELRDKVIKVAKTMDAEIYSQIPKNKSKRQELELSLLQKSKELEKIIKSTSDQILEQLNENSHHINSWSLLILKQVKIYETIAFFKFQDSKFVIAEGWCPLNKLQDVKSKLGMVSLTSKSSENQNKKDSRSPEKEMEYYSSGFLDTLLTVIKTKNTPPTYIETNKFTKGFQNIVDAYGIASYKEVNPGLFTIVSFPFLFAVMFGDIGHGFIMLLFSLFLVTKEQVLLHKYKSNEMFKMIIEGRYIILLMAIFSMFTGFIYNDMFSLSLPIFKSAWLWTSNRETNKLEAFSLTKDYTYPIGIDPAWHGAENNLIFTNSLKMKMSVILGVIHMLFGIILGFFNHFKLKKKYNIVLQTIPQLLFMLSIFGYLCFTIIYKWSINWFEKDASGNSKHNTPPGLLNMLIYMFLKPGDVNQDEQLFNGQGLTQLILLLVAALCVPIMLLGTPLYLKLKNNKKTRLLAKSSNINSNSLNGTYQSSALVPNNNTSGPVDINTSTDKNNVPENINEESFDFGDIMIHQIIHTIEFCLGCISNTASYLRLWALSLAHAQLSIVLFDMTLKKVLNFGIAMKIIFLIVTVPIWLALTICILIVMEGLSAFLHALRLHWVEFNNKFYDGNGYAYNPFNLHNIDFSNHDINY